MSCPPPPSDFYLSPLSPCCPHSSYTGLWDQPLMLLAWNVLLTDGLKAPSLPLVSVQTAPPGFPCPSYVKQYLSPITLCPLSHLILLPHQAFHVCLCLGVYRLSPSMRKSAPGIWGFVLSTAEFQHLDECWAHGQSSLSVVVKPDRAGVCVLRGG